MFKSWYLRFGLILVVLGGAVLPASGDDGQYLIGPGDILEIAEWKNPDLTKTVVVLPDGKITFPLLREVMVAGKTVGQLTTEISKALKPYVPAPNVSIIIQQVNSLWIYVIGKVNNPGRFEVNSNINVMQALAMAGGLNKFANEDKITVFRADGKKTQMFAFDYGDVSEGKAMEQNIVLNRGDVVVVR